MDTNWKDVGAIFAVSGTVVAAVYWILAKSLVDDFDKRYMRKTDCINVHKVSDTMLAAFRDDMKEIKDTIKEIKEDVKGALKGINEVIYSAIKLK